MKQVPNIYNNEVNRVSNQRIKRAVEYDLENYAVKKAQYQILYNWLKT